MKRSVSPSKLNAIAVSAMLVFCAGCHSAFIQVTVQNRSPQPVQLFEMDYPSASFGGGELRSGAAFHYRFKVLGEGAMKFTWTDGDGKDHTATGPNVHEGDEGTLAVTLRGDTAVWDSQLRSRSQSH